MTRTPALCFYWEFFEIFLSLRWTKIIQCNAQRLGFCFPKRHKGRHSLARGNFRLLLIFSDLLQWNLPQYSRSANLVLVINLKKKICNIDIWACIGGDAGKMISGVNGSLRDRYFINFMNERTSFAFCREIWKYRVDY